MIFLIVPLYNERASSQGEPFAPCRGSIILEARLFDSYASAIMWRLNLEIYARAVSNFFREDCNARRSRMGTDYNATFNITLHLHPCDERAGGHDRTRRRGGVELRWVDDFLSSRLPLRRRHRARYGVS